MGAPYGAPPNGGAHAIMAIRRDGGRIFYIYYVPERPRLARNDGVPEFIFLKYRRDITDNAAFDPDTK